MSNYLETLVEKMVADGVSENDIKSVIKEVNGKKSPLHQDIGMGTGTTGGEPGDVSLSEGDVAVEEGGKTSADVSVYPSEVSKEEISDKEKCENEDKCWDDDLEVCNRCIEDEEEEEEDVVKEEEEEEEEISEHEQNKIDAEKFYEENDNEKGEHEKLNQKSFNRYMKMKREGTLDEYGTFSIEEEDDQDDFLPITKNDFVTTYMDRNKNNQLFERNLFLRIPHFAEGESDKLDPDLQKTYNEMMAKIKEEHGPVVLLKNKYTAPNGEEFTSVFSNASLAINAAVIDPFGEQESEHPYVKRVDEYSYQTDFGRAWEVAEDGKKFILFSSDEDADKYISQLEALNNNFTPSADYNPEGLTSKNFFEKGIHVGQGMGMPGNLPGVINLDPADAKYLNVIEGEEKSGLLKKSEILRFTSNPIYPQSEYNNAADTFFSGDTSINIEYWKRHHLIEKWNADVFQYLVNQDRWMQVNEKFKKKGTFYKRLQFYIDQQLLLESSEIYRINRGFKKKNYLDKLATEGTREYKIRKFGELINSKLEKALNNSLLPEDMKELETEYQSFITSFQETAGKVDYLLANFLEGNYKKQWAKNVKRREQIVDFDPGKDLFAIDQGFEITKKDQERQLKRLDAAIKKNNPEARKSFRARHNCDSPGPRHKARYWSCRKW